MTAAATPAAPIVPTAPAAPLTEQQRQDAALAVTAAQVAKLATLTASDPAAVVTAPPVVATKPAGVPDKFWNAAKGEVDYAAWGTSHASLETEFHKGRQTTTPPAVTPPAVTPPVVDPAAPAVTPPAVTPPVVDARKSAIDAATVELSTSGKLSDATYTSLEKVGYDKTMVDTYIAGQQAQVAPLQKAAFEAVGGTREAYTAMVQWAAENLTETEIAAYDAQVNSKNEAVIKAATSALAVKHRAAVTVEGQRLGGQPPATPSGVFNSKNEMVTAMNAVGPNGRRLYDTDAAYRDGVIKKIAASREAGIEIYR